jgi:hypothetical protein
MGNSSSSDLESPATRQTIPVNERAHRIQIGLADAPKWKGPTNASERAERAERRVKDFERRKLVREAKLQNVQARWEENRKHFVQKGSQEQVAVVDDGSGKFFVWCAKLEIPCCSLPCMYSTVD